MTVVSKRSIKRSFAAVEAAAAAGERCPRNAPFGPIQGEALRMLADRGDVYIEIFRENWRVVTILKGPHAGKKTAPPPFVAAPYLIIDKNGSTKYSPPKTSLCDRIKNCATETKSRLPQRHYQGNFEL